MNRRKEFNWALLQIVDVFEQEKYCRLAYLACLQSAGTGPDWRETLERGLTPPMRSEGIVMRPEAVDRFYVAFLDTFVRMRVIVERYLKEPSTKADGKRRLVTLGKDWVRFWTTECALVRLSRITHDYFAKELTPEEFETRLVQFTREFMDLRKKWA